MDVEGAIAHLARDEERSRFGGEKQSQLGWEMRGVCRSRSAAESRRHGFSQTHLDEKGDRSTWIGSIIVPGGSSLVSVDAQPKPEHQNAIDWLSGFMGNPILAG
ncbi:MAG: hypothetical protein F6K36_30565 [Symploca sp. SIO3C6]|nr:hypothetical protein [Symploca sp. SIO3C6]